MIVYSGLKSDFLFAVEQDSIAAQIEETIYDKMHRHTSQNEFRYGKILWNICIKF